jgi:chromosome partitioning protein
MTNTLKKFKAFSEPEGGAGFVWESGKPYSTEAFVNLLRVAEELLVRVGA